MFPLGFVAKTPPLPRGPDVLQVAGDQKGWLNMKQAGVGSVLKVRLSLPSRTPFRTPFHRPFTVLALPCVRPSTVLSPYSTVLSPPFHRPLTPSRRPAPPTSGRLEGLLVRAFPGRLDGLLVRPARRQHKGLLRPDRAQRLPAVPAAPLLAADVQSRARCSPPCSACCSSAVSLLLLLDY